MPIPRLESEPATQQHRCDDTPSWSPGVLAGAGAGIAAAVAGLGAAELAASLSPSMPSPIISIGNQVVDNVPQPVKQFAIDTFGTSDKLVLVLGIVIVVTLAAASIGILALTRRTAAAWATAGLTAIAGAAAVMDASSPLLALVPALVAALVAVPLLLHLTRSNRRSQHQSSAVSPTAGEQPAAGRHDTIDPASVGTRTQSDDDGRSTTNTATTTTHPAAAMPRRRFLTTAGGSLALGTLAAAGGRLVNQRFAVAARESARELPAATSVAPSIPAAAHPQVAGLSPFVTPNADFYRIDTSLTVPRLSADGWTLRIHGMVDQEVSFTYDELLAMDSVDIPITLTCVSNEVGGNLAGTARWQGVRLADLLDRAGIQTGATQLVGRANDGWTAGFPTEAAFDRDTLVAYGMNGQPLPAEHGFPLRLITPGLYGYVSATKWLTDIEATTFDDFEQYWVERGWVDQAPIKVSSRIDTPGGLSTVERGTVAVAGVAWAQTRGIGAVEVQVDDGAFEPAELADEVTADTWRQWVFRWDTNDIEGGRHQLTVRATDADGVVQPQERTPPFPSGATGWHSLAVMVAEQ